MRLSLCWLLDRLGQTDVQECLATNPKLTGDPATDLRSEAVLVYMALSSSAAI